MNNLVAFLVCCLGLASAGLTNVKLYDLDQAESYFAEFMQTYNKEYATPAEKEMRFRIFRDNLGRINKANRMDNPVYGITKFSDLTSAEFKSMYTGLGAPEAASPCAAVVFNSSSFSAPEEFDWRHRNAVTKVKNQGECGSCWSFSTTGNIEGQYAIVHNQLIELSESQLVDCDTSNKACDGGLMSNAVLYVKNAGGIMSESDYPYWGKRYSCEFDQDKVAAKVSGCNQYQFSSEDELKETLASTGPLAITVCAAQFQSYTGGVMTNCNQGQNDHAVLLVGYGTENGTPFWIIKNSWGPGWGERGYIRVQRNVNSCNLMGPGSLIVSAVVA